MKTTFKRTMRQLLTDKMAGLRDIHKLSPPACGWLKAVRLAVGMPSTYAARKLSITPRSFRQFEENEAAGTITLKTLKRAADAINCEVLYAIVPRAGSLDAMIEKQAQKRAQALVHPVAHSMLLEGQSTAAPSQQLEELSKQLASNPNASLWDEG